MSVFVSKQYQNLLFNKLTKKELPVKKLTVTQANTPAKKMGRNLWFISQVDLKEEPECSLLFLLLWYSKHVVCLFCLIYIKSE